MRSAPQHRAIGSSPHAAGMTGISRYRIAMLVAVLLVCSLLPARPGAAGLAASERPPRAAPAVPGEFLLRFRPQTTPAQRQRALAELGLTPFDAIPALEIVVARVSGSGPAPTPQADALLLERLHRHPLIAHAEPNLILSIAQEPAATPGPLYLPLVVAPPTFVPNDPDRSRQYAWERIAAYQGWTLNRGSAAVVIAIVDTGIQLDHPDLRDKLVPGYDIVDNDPIADDGNGHGTHVAGIAGAITNNATGVAGTCPGCRLMPVRVLDNSGSGTLSDVISGILWAAEHGARVINLSLTSSFDSSLLEDALGQAQQRGALPICAAGNDWQYGGTQIYPAVYDVCLAVAATDQNDVIASFSNRGTWVELAAPGVAIYSTTTNSGYASFSGTSMATPYVAGVAGLLASQGLSNNQIRARLCGTADLIAGTGVDWSCGRLNLLRAVAGY